MMTRTLGLVLVALISAPAFADVPSKDALLVAWESNWTPISDLSITWDTECDTPGAVPAYSKCLRTNGLQYFIRMERFARGALNLEEVSFDPSSGLGRCLNDGPGAVRPLGWISSVETNGGNRAQHFGEFLTRMLRPLEVTNGWERHSLSHMLADPASEVRAELETIDGRPAAVLDVFSLVENKAGIGVARVMTVWLDVERNAVPLKWRSYSVTGAVLGTHELVDYQEFNGAFLPTRIETRWGSDSPFGATNSRLQVSTNEKGPLLAVNSGLTAEDCTVSFPPGTMVTNEVEEDMVIVRGDGRALDVAYASTRRPESPGSASAIALALAAALSLFGGFGLRFAMARG